MVKDLNVAKMIGKRLLWCCILAMVVLFQVTIRTDAQARGNLAAINDIVARATRKSDKTAVKKKIEEKLKAPPKRKWSFSHSCA